MKLNSRSTLGVVIGGVQIFGFLFIVVYIIIVLTKLQGLSSKDAESHNDDVAHWYSVLLYILLVACLIATFTSVLLIVGIIKRRSTMMKPWIYINIFGIGVTILRILAVLFSGFSGDYGFNSVFRNILLGLLALCVQILILKNIHNLCKKIQEENQLWNPK